MNLKELRASGAFVKAPPVPVEITWHHIDPDTGTEAEHVFTVHVRKVSAGWVDRAAHSAHAFGAVAYPAAMISGAVLFGPNLEECSYEDAYLMDPALRDACMDAFNKVNHQIPRRPHKGDESAPAETAEGDIDPKF